MRFKFVVLNIVILLVHYATALSDGPQNKASYYLEGLRNYELLFDYVQDGNLLEKRFWIARVENGVNYEILDSLKAAVIEACDTNAIMFDAVDDTNTHLISLRLSPVITYDTLLSQNNKASDNWITNLANGFCCSLKDSIIVYGYGSGEPYSAEIKILKILPGNKWLKMKSISGVYLFSISKDFSQVFICISHSLGDDEKEKGNVLVYDIYLDTLYNMPQLGSNNLVARRFSRDSNIYVLKRDGDTNNLWEYSNSNKIKQITFRKYPEIIDDFKIFADKIIYLLRDGTGNTPYVKRIKLNLD